MTEDRKIKQAYDIGYGEGILYALNLFKTLNHHSAHGHWIKRTKVHPDLLNESTYNYECSNCGYCDTHGADVKVPYCWHCGAKMDEEEETWKI